MNLTHFTPTIKTGNEPLICNGEHLNYCLLDFWKWNTSDLLSNATRGRLAEFIVATAINADVNGVRTEWDAYDLLSPEGIKIEVKSCAYLQSWHQRIFSKISFNIRATRAWNYETSKHTDIVQRQADVYVFCLLKHQDKATVNPLDTDQWDFFVLSTPQLNNYKRSQHSITLKSLQQITPIINYTEIHSAIKNTLISLNQQSLNNS